MTVDTQLELYHFEGCPYCEKVRRALNYYGLEYESHIIDPADRSKVREISGQPLVPVLVDGNNVVHDSTRIITYLDEHYSNSPHLIPEAPDDQAHAFIWNEFSELVWGDLGYKAQKGTDMDGNVLSEHERADLRSEIQKQSDQLNKYLSGNEYLAGDALSIGDIALSSFISRIQEFSEYSLPDEHSQLWEWYERVDDSLNAGVAAEI